MNEHKETEEDENVTEEEIRYALRNYIEVCWRIFEKREVEKKAKPKKEEDDLLRGINEGY